MEREQISHLYSRYGPLIYRRCLRLLGNMEKARDATQEVFVRTLRHAKKLSSEKESLPWLYTVATNYCLNQLRDERKLEFRPPEKMPELKKHLDAEKWVAARQSLLQLLGGFEPKTQQIVIHALMDGMTQEEISQVMGLSRRTVGKKLKQFYQVVLELKEKDR